MWLCTVASGCGILQGRPGSGVIQAWHQPTTLDRVKTDVHLVLEGVWDGVEDPAVDVQVKTTTALRKSGGYFSYDLDIPTYNKLRSNIASTPRALVVIGLQSEGERILLKRDGTLLVGRGAWASLAGRRATKNTESIAVRLPAANTIDRAGLMRMMTSLGVRSSTPVPIPDVWEHDDVEA
jgi:hypothetical protein